MPRGVQAVYTLTFDDDIDWSNAKLVIDGWTVYWFTGPVGGTALGSIEVVDDVGVWTEVQQFGPTAGDFKRMTVPLGDVFLSDDHRVRVRMPTTPTSQPEVDRMSIDDSAPVSPVVVAMPLRSADLHHAGTVTRTEATMAHRRTALDDHREDTPTYYGYGAFTRYGDVLDLLGAVDDRFAIIRHGDEVTLQRAHRRATAVLGHDALSLWRRAALSR